jgi:hypothetical protein
VVEGVGSLTGCVMRPRHVNRNFTKPEAIGPMVFFLSSFEHVVKALNLSPEEYQNSPKLKEWVWRNKDHRYVLPALLEAFGFRVDTES